MDDDDAVRADTLLIYTHNDKRSLRMETDSVSLKETFSF